MMRIVSSTCPLCRTTSRAAHSGMRGWRAWVAAEVVHVGEGVVLAQDAMKRHCSTQESDSDSLHDLRHHDAAMQDSESAEPLSLRNALVSSLTVGRCSLN
eukprot:587330-Rhodomonas_salina.1